MIARVACLAGTCAASQANAASATPTAPAGPVVPQRERPAACGNELRELEREVHEQRDGAGGEQQDECFHRSRSSSPAPLLGPLMQHAIALNGAYFTTQRVDQEYVTHAYLA